MNKEKIMEVADKVSNDLCKDCINKMSGLTVSRKDMFNPRKYKEILDKGKSMLCNDCKKKLGF